MVKELRQRTQAGYTDCKKALVESGNDLDKAIDWLRKKGLCLNTFNTLIITPDIPSIYLRPNQ